MKTDQASRTTTAGGSPLERGGRRQRAGREIDKHAGPWKREPAREIAPVNHQAAARTRKKIGYETDVPRCENCCMFQKARTMLVDSLPRYFKANCRQFRLHVDPNAICNSWTGADGACLDA